MTSTMFRTGSPVVLAHRGGTVGVAENSRQAVESMLASGVTTMETDLRATSDGVAVLAHDVTLERRFTDPRRVSDVTWWELDLIRDVDHQSALRLVDVLAEFPTLRLNIDLKSDDVVAPALRAVRAAGAVDRVLLTSFSSRRLAIAERITRGRTALGTGMADAARLLAESRGLVSLARRSTTAAPPTGRAVQVPLRFKGVDVVTPRFLELAHEREHVVHVWTINDPGEMHRLLDLGVDGIVTDDPAAAVAVWAERGLEPAPL